MSDANKKNQGTTSHVEVDESLKNDLLNLKESILKVVSNFPEIRKPLHDSSRDVPIATHQLDRVTEQTEEAANKVLGLVEGIANSLSDIIGNANTALNEIRDSNFSCKNAITCLEKVDELANHCQSASYTIMDALQFQDITAQQINHAANLLEGVEVKLSGIINQLFKDDPSELSETTKITANSYKERAYNPDAHMTDLKSSQTEIDELVNQTSKIKTVKSANPKKN